MTEKTYDPAIIQEVVPARLNYRKTFLLGFGFFGVSVIWMVYNAFVPLFLANKFDLDPALDRLLHDPRQHRGVVDPAAGRGLVRPAAHAHWPAYALHPDRRADRGAGLWADPAGRHAAAVRGLHQHSAYLSMAFWRTPVVPLMPDITPSPYRSQANGIINFMGGIGSIIATLGGGALYDMNQAFPFWLGSVLVILARALLVFLFIREPKTYETSQQDKPDLWKSLCIDRQIQRKKRAAYPCWRSFFWFVAYNAIEAFFTLYAQNHLGL